MTMALTFTTDEKMGAITIPNVSSIMVVFNSFGWQRPEKNSYFMVDIAWLEKRYKNVFLFGPGVIYDLHERDCAKYIIWNHEFVYDMTMHEVYALMTEQRRMASTIKDGISP